MSLPRALLATLCLVAIALSGCSKSNNNSNGSGLIRVVNAFFEAPSLDYVIAGDLLYLGEADNKTVVSALFYLIRVADGKIVVVGRVKKDGDIGKVFKVIDDVADELFSKAYEN